MGPPSYFVKIRKRTITILPPIKPNPLPYTLTPFPWQTDTELRNTWSCRSTQMDLHNVQEQMCSTFSTFRIHHVSSRTRQRPTWQWTTPTLLQLIWRRNISSQYFDEQPHQRRKRIPSTNTTPRKRITLSWWQQYRRYFNDTAVLQWKTFVTLLPKSRILITQGLSISTNCYQYKDLRSM